MGVQAALTKAERVELFVRRVPLSLRQWLVRLALVALLFLFRLGLDVPFMRTWVWFLVSLDTAGGGHRGRLDGGCDSAEGDHGRRSAVDESGGEGCGVGVRTGGPGVRR